MKLGQIIAIGILIAFGVAAAMAYTGLLAIDMIIIYAAGALLVVGLGAGQMLKKSDVVPLVGVLVLVGIAGVLAYSGGLPFLQTTSEQTYAGGIAFVTGLFTGRTL
jgi:hypothetical protein